MEIAMAEMRFQVETGFLNNLQDKLGASKSTDVARDALTLLNWAVKERAAGREIGSFSGDAIHAKLEMAALNNVPDDSAK